MDDAALAHGLDALGRWRAAVGARLGDLQLALDAAQLLDPVGTQTLQGLRARLDEERLIVAIVAEVSRGKTELINALCFADSGRRILPATPGRTTMCPVELGWDPAQPAQLALLPIETRRQARTLGGWRAQPAAWTRLALDVADPAGMAETLKAVTERKRVPLDEARALGLLREPEASGGTAGPHPAADAPPAAASTGAGAAQDRPPPRGPGEPADAAQPDAEGRVEIPAWRHAVINLPHPLLQSGLAVLDTPGLNALGVEPDLTLDLLPAVHAVLFVVAADSGVTRSDLATWHEQFDAPGLLRLVALNKVDALEDPLLPPAQVAAQIEAQCQATATALGVARSAVFPVSARRALLARIKRDPALLAASGLPALEAALAEQLLPRRQALLLRQALSALEGIEARCQQRLGERRRSLGEQVVELQTLRGRHLRTLDPLHERAEQEARQLAQLAARLRALRSVQLRLQQTTLAALSDEELIGEVQSLMKTIRHSRLRLGARAAFNQLCQRLLARFDGVQAGAEEICRMLVAGQARLEAEAGWRLPPPTPPDFLRYRAELALIERGHERHLGPTRIFELMRETVLSRFATVLHARLATLFAQARRELDDWGRAALQPAEVQLQERERALQRRRDALQRIDSAGSELDQRVSELGQLDRQQLGQQGQLGERLRALRQLLNQGPDSAWGGLPPGAGPGPHRPDEARGDRRRA